MEKFPIRQVFLMSSAAKSYLEIEFQDDWIFWKENRV
jgi:hypothetical protein